MERHLLTYNKPLLELPLVGIDRRAVAARLSVVAAKHGAVSANRMRTSLSAFFSWCMGEGLLENNPALGTNRQEEKSRERALNDDELKAIWNATAGSDDYSAIVRLLMLTGQRANEIGSLAWSEIRDDRIVLPGTRVKNGHDHTIPMSAPVRAILDARPRNDGFVFGARAGRPFSGWGTRKVALDRRLNDAGINLEHWTIHDLRRSVATGMAELGTPPHVIEAVLNHVSGHKSGVAGIYNRANYEPQKRIALQSWADHLEAIVSGKRRSSVVELRRA